MKWTIWIKGTDSSRTSLFTNARQNHADPVSWKKQNQNQTKPQMGSPRKACDDKVVINLSAKYAQGIYFKPQIKIGSWAQLSINIFRKEMLHGSKLGILH